MVKSPVEAPDRSIKIGADAYELIVQMARKEGRTLKEVLWRAVQDRAKKANGR